MKISIAILLGCLTSFGMEAHAQYRTCVDSHLAKVKESPALGIAPSEVDRLVSRVSESIGLKRPITLVPCSSVEKAYAWPDDKSPELEYIIYNPDWIRGILGKDEVQAIALFGHEMGHFFNGDFTVRKNFPGSSKKLMRITLPDVPLPEYPEISLSLRIYSTVYATSRKHSTLVVSKASRAQKTDSQNVVVEHWLHLRQFQRQHRELVPCLSGAIRHR